MRAFLFVVYLAHTKNKRREATFVFRAQVTSKPSAKQMKEREARVCEFLGEEARVCESILTGSDNNGKNKCNASFRPEKGTI